MCAGSKFCRLPGFTLVELLIVIVLLGILAAVGTNMLSDGFKTTSMVNANNSSEAEARYAMERLVREIREIQYVTASNAYNITTPSANPAGGFVFVNNNNITVTINQTTVSGVKRVNLGYSTPVTVPAQPQLVSQVSDCTFTFYDIAGTKITTLANIPDELGFVDIELKVTDSTSGQQIAQYMRVAMRNH